MQKVIYLFFLTILILRKESFLILITYIVYLIYHMFVNWTSIHIIMGVPVKQIPNKLLVYALPPAFLWLLCLLDVSLGLTYRTANKLRAGRDLDLSLTVGSYYYNQTAQGERVSVRSCCETWDGKCTLSCLKTMSR